MKKIIFPIVLVSVISIFGCGKQTEKLAAIKTQKDLGFAKDYYVQMRRRLPKNMLKIVSRIPELMKAIESDEKNLKKLNKLIKEAMFLGGVTKKTEDAEKTIVFVMERIQKHQKLLKQLKTLRKLVSFILLESDENSEKAVVVKLSMFYKELTPKAKEDFWKWCKDPSCFPIGSRISIPESKYPYLSPELKGLPIERKAEENNRGKVIVGEDVFFETTHAFFYIYKFPGILEEDYDNALKLFN